MKNGARSGGRPVGSGKKYNWAEWFKDDSFTLVKGIDFQCTCDAMCRQVRSNASMHNVRVTTSIISSEEIQVEVSNQ